MKVLMISTDRKIFEEGSAVQNRVVEYGSFVEELHVVIFSGPAYAGRQVASLTLTTRVLPFLYSLRSLKIRSRKDEGVKIPNSNVTLYPTNSINRWFYVFDAVKVGWGVVRNWKLEIRNSSNKNEILVTCQDPFETGLVGWTIARKFKTKLQLQVHTDFLSKYFTKESLLNRIRIIIAKFLLPKADGVRVVSGRIKRSIIGRGLIKDESLNHSVGQAKIRVLPIFVDIEGIKNTQPIPQLKESYPQFDFIFLVASRLEKEKNVDFIIKSFGEVVKKHPKAGLIIVGDGSKRKSLQSIVDSLQIKKNVVFEGWQNNLTEYYKAFDLFLSASSYEGFGLTLVEAGMSGCPILTTNVGIVGEILGEENSLVCDVGDSDCFVNKMIFAIENKEVLQGMNTKAQRKIELNLINDKQKYLEEYVDGWKMVK